MPTSAPCGTCNNIRLVNPQGICQQCYRGVEGALLAARITLDEIEVRVKDARSALQHLVNVMAKTHA